MAVYRPSDSTKLSGPPLSPCEMNVIFIKKHATRRWDHSIYIAGARALSDRGADDGVGDDGAINAAAFSIGNNSGEGLAQNRADGRNACELKNRN